MDVLPHLTYGALGAVVMTAVSIAKALGVLFLLERCHVDVIFLPLPTDSANCRSYKLESREGVPWVPRKAKGQIPECTRRLGNSTSTSKYVFYSQKSSA